LILENNLLKDIESKLKIEKQIQNDELYKQNEIIKHENAELKNSINDLNSEKIELNKINSSMLENNNNLKA
jgi:hypothetical protein